MNQCRQVSSAAVRGMLLPEHRPGDPAPSSDAFEELNVFGTPTGRVAVVTKGEKLPDSARGFTWRSLGQCSSAELRARAAEYRHIADTAKTAPVMDRLRNLADRFDALADQRERDGPGQP